MDARMDGEEPENEERDQKKWVKQARIGKVQQGFFYEERMKNWFF